MLRKNRDKTFLLHKDSFLSSTKVIWQLIYNYIQISRNPIKWRNFTSEAYGNNLKLKDSAGAYIGLFSMSAGCLKHYYNIWHCTHFSWAYAGIAII